MVIDQDIRTTDVGEAEKLFAQVYRRARLRESEHPFVFQQSIRGDERVSIARYRVEGRAEVSMDIEGVLGVGSRLAGTYRVSSNGQDVDPDGAFLLGPGAAASSFADLDLVMVYLAADALAGMAEGREGSSVRVGSASPMTPTLRQQWTRAQRFAMETLGDPQLLGNDLIRRSVTDLLLTNALACFAIEVDAAGAGHGAHPATLRRAMRFVEDNAARPIGVDEIAAAARLSRRGVQDLFRRSLGVTPTGYLQRVRLDGARQELESGDASDVSVQEIASRWGFVHLPRFAARHREEYGEYPSQTLRR
ncbi:helix-turn-helix domain-containing protein [Leifsonia sp. NPDC077715]|uniref:helix-turn-helix domain-containing protein n=1 Tax=Leifsonia sp. NPDC077715 TaxID=3155539 RepID=UPI00342A24D0